MKNRKRFCAVLLLFALALGGCENAVRPIPARPEDAQNFYSDSDGGVLFESALFDIKVFPVTLIEEEEILLFAYQVKLWNKTRAVYRDLNIRVEWNDGLKQYLDGPNYLGIIQFPGGDRCQVHILETEKQISPPQMQIDQGVADRDIVEKAEDIAILENVSREATMILETSSVRAEIPFTFAYSHENER